MERTWLLGYHLAVDHVATMVIVVDIATLCLGLIVRICTAGFGVEILHAIVTLGPETELLEFDRCEAIRIVTVAAGRPLSILTSGLSLGA